MTYDWKRFVAPTLIAAVAIGIFVMTLSIDNKDKSR